MTPEKQARIKELRAKLKSLAPDQKQALINNGLIATIEGRTLSPNNTLLCYIQSRGAIPTVVGGFRQWLAAGRVVSKGQHGLTIYFPSNNQSEDDNEDMRFYTATVFDISQTEELTTGKQSPTTPTASPAIIPTLTPTPLTPKQSSSNEPEIMKGWTIV